MHSLKAILLFTFIGFFSTGWGAAANPALPGKGNGHTYDDPSRFKLKSLSRNAQWDDLLTVATTAVEREPADPEPIIFRIRALRMLGKLKLATTTAHVAIIRFPDNSSLFLEQAWIHAFQGDWPNALIAARHAEKLKTDLTEALIVQGIADREMSRWDQAISVFTKAATKTPKNPIIFLNRGRAWVEKNNWQKGLVDLEKAAKLNPDSAEAFFYLGLAYKGLDEPIKAGLAFNRAIKIQPMAAALYTARGEILERLGKWKEAGKDAYTALALGAKGIRPYLTACRAAIALRDWQALAEYTEGGLAIAPNNNELHHFSGRAYRELGETKKAVAAYDRALQLDPDNEQILLERAAANIMTYNYAKAEKDCDTALQIRPSARAYSTRAVIKFKLGKLDDAYDDSTNAITLNPTSVTAYLVRGQCLAALGRNNEARHDLEKAASLDPSVQNATAKILSSLK